MHKRRLFCILLIIFQFFMMLYGEDNGFTLQLSGTWKAKIGDTLEWAGRETDESGWTDIELPSANYLQKHTKELFEDVKPSLKTFIWFRKTVIINPLPDNIVYLQIGEIQNADEVYLNGIRIGATGSFPPNFHSGWRNFRNYPIDPKLFAKGENTIAIRVFSDVENWIMAPMQLTDNPKSNFIKMIRDLTQINIFEYYSILLIWIAMYFMIFYFMRRQEIENLYFSLTSICMAIIILTWYYDTRYPFLPVPSNYIYAFCQSGLFFFTPLLSLFLFTYLNKTVMAKRKILTLAGPIIGSVLLIFSMERSWILSVRAIFLALQPIFFIVIYIDLFKAIRAKKPHSMQMTLTVVPFTLFAVRDILAFVFGIGTNGEAYFVYGLPPFFFLFAIQFIQQFVASMNQTEKLKASFYRFVPVEFLKIIGRTNINDVRLGDSTHQKLTVLFTDICQFSQISEKMEPKEIFSLLNSYLAHMVPVVQRHKGFVDKYIGDAIMALFPDTPDDALLAAISLRKTLRVFNSIQEKNNGLILASGTGIHFGELILGTIGDADRMEGTVVADTVNLASRIESLTRFYGCDILLSGIMKSLVSAPQGSIFRFIDRVAVAGRNATVELYELLWDIEDEKIKPRVMSLEIYVKALEAYYRNDLPKAKMLFLQVLGMDSADTVTAIYLSRIDQIEQKKMNWKDHIVFNQK